MTGEGEVKGIDYYGQWDDSDINIIRGGVDVVTVGEGISRSKLGARENFPDNVEVL